MKDKELIKILSQNPESEVVFLSDYTEVDSICFNETDCDFFNTNFKFDKKFLKWNHTFESNCQSIKDDIVIKDWFILYPLNIGE